MSILGSETPTRPAMHSTDSITQVALINRDPMAWPFFTGPIELGGNSSETAKIVERILITVVPFTTITSPSSPCLSNVLRPEAHCSRQETVPIDYTSSEQPKFSTIVAGYLVK